jgi:hypothetical protein
MGTWSFPGVKRPGRSVHHPPPTSAGVKGTIEIYNIHLVPLTSLLCILKKNSLSKNFSSVTTLHNLEVRVASVASIAVAVSTGCRKSHKKFNTNRPSGSEDKKGGKKTTVTSHAYSIPTPKQFV